MWSVQVTISTNHPLMKTHHVYVYALKITETSVHEAIDRNIQAKITVSCKRVSMHMYNRTEKKKKRSVCVRRLHNGYLMIDL